MTRPLALATIALAVAAAAAPARAERPRILVLPLPSSSAVDTDLARAFDARFLVALDDTGVVATVTPSIEPECTTRACLAALATAEGARQVVSVSVVREDAALTVFATLIEADTAAAVRRAELAGVPVAELARQAPAELARQLVGARPGAAAVVAVARPASGVARASAVAVIDRLAAVGGFTVLPLDQPRAADKATVTHRAAVVVRDFAIVKRRHHVHRYLDGVLVATLSITDVADGRAVFARTVRVTASRRARYASTAEVTALLVEDAVADWMTAFRAGNVETRLTGGTR